MASETKKGLELERLLFFSDAIVAIAITLLALELKVEVPAGQHLSFADLLRPWKVYLAFMLSFINIAGFWQTHHTIFSYVRKMDDRMLGLNLIWLFFIVIVPFSTSLVSTHFTDTPAIFLYSTNIFLLSLFQKLIWDYGDDTIPENMDPQMVQRIDVMFTLNLINGITAIVVSFIWPRVAFILLFFKIPLFILASFYVAAQRRKERHGTQNRRNFRS